MWGLTNLSVPESSNIHQISYQNYTFFSDEMLPDPKQGQNAWVCDGYLLPRKDLSGSFSSHTSAELADAIFREYEDQFINYVKGHFNLIQLMPDKFRVYSDHFGIKKYFYWQKNGQFIISNDLKTLSNLTRLTPSPLGMSVYALAYHFTGGLTAFEDTFHNQPAECIEYKDNQLHVTSYWEPQALLQLPEVSVSIEEISASLKKAVQSTLQQNERISLSLTGGADTRNLLSIFLSMGKKPHLYSYGNPDSNDCMKASAIARGLGIDHQIHDIKMTATLFEDNARRIIRQGGGLASIHRVHRLLAVEFENQFANQMYLGTLGGEFVKGVSEDHYIVPAIVFGNWDRNLTTRQELERYLVTKRLSASSELADDLLAYFQSESFMNGPKITRKHLSLTHITAHLHDAQDVNLYATVMDRVYTPFLDIDYLETLFSSEFTFNKKEEIQNWYLRKIENPVYASNFLKVTYPSLMYFKYSGEHKPSEVCFNKYLAALLKGIRQKITPDYPPNFLLGTWMADFVENNLSLCHENEAVNQVFNIDRLLQDFKDETHGKNEAYWLKYTNPIMMRFLIEEFCG
ncbi:MAG: hypothetical protein RBR67_16360 [Desulfobacterium sp.]|nr:hypothetical protein [Desulfobacterium sp.]